MIYGKFYRLTINIIPGYYWLPGKLGEKQEFQNNIDGLEKVRNKAIFLKKKIKKIMIIIKIFNFHENTAAIIRKNNCCF